MEAKSGVDSKDTMYYVPRPFKPSYEVFVWKINYSHCLYAWFTETKL